MHLILVANSICLAYPIHPDCLKETGDAEL